MKKKKNVKVAITFMDNPNIKGDVENYLTKTEIKGAIRDSLEDSFDGIENLKIKVK